MVELPICDDSAGLACRHCAPLPTSCIDPLSSLWSIDGAMLTIGAVEDILVEDLLGGLIVPLGDRNSCLVESAELVERTREACDLDCFASASGVALAQRVGGDEVSGVGYCRRHYFVYVVLVIEPVPALLAALAEGPTLDEPQRLAEILDPVGSSRLAAGT